MTDDLAAQARSIAGRYELRDILGHGGYGEVWEAHDTLNQSLVAIKLLRANLGIQPIWMRREVSALRLLRIPGVAQMLDEGIENGRPFLVMERIFGSPFPGTPARSWPSISRPTLAVLETLSRVHAAGVVHRDIKPANVLVDEYGSPTLLDFGLSVGPAMARETDAEGHIVGTPDYLAPEQISGDIITAATDLYALGVMLYEALSGRLPHESDDFQALMRMRLAEQPPSLLDVAPGVPIAIAKTIDALLARERNDRPQSAHEVIAQLRDPIARPSAPRSPFFGHRQAVETLVHAAQMKQSMDLLGMPGMGRTRTLQEVASVLADQGIDTLWTVPGKRPFSSLSIWGYGPNPNVSPAFGGPEESKPRNPEMVHSLLREILGNGRVILVDDERLLDRHSRSALERARAFGSILRVIDVTAENPRPERNDVVVLAPWSEALLRDLFVGPDRVFHLREDAAHELFARSQAWPSRIFGELRAWERGGLAQKVGTQWLLSRESLNHLAAGRVALPSPPPIMAPDPATPVPPYLEDLLMRIELSWPHTHVGDLSRATEQPMAHIESAVQELVGCGAVVQLPDGRMIARSRKILSSPRYTEKRKQVHRSMARVLPRGADGRLFHLIAAQNERETTNSTEIINETLAVAEPLVAQGFIGRATVLLSDGLRAARGP